MWPFDEEENPLDEQTLEFKEVADSIYENSEDSIAGLSALQDAYGSYEFADSVRAKEIFTTASDSVRKKFGDTQAFDYDTTLEMAPYDVADFTPESEDPEEAKLELINKWEEENLKYIEESSDPKYLQAKSQLTRGIKQNAAMQRRDYYGKDNYIVTDLALRFGEGAISPIAELAGADSVTNFFEEQTDPDRDDSYWSAIASGAGSGVAAVGAGVATGGVGTFAYLGASGAGAVRKQVEDSLENEGTVTEALTAGGIEAVNQTVQAGVGTKVFGGVAKQILGKTTSKLGARVFPRIAGNMALEGGTESVGGVVSKIAENIGQDKEDDIFQGFSQNLVAGLVVGGAASGIGEIAAKRQANLAKNEDPQSVAINGLKSVMADVEGSPPPAPESIPAGRQSVDLEAAPEGSMTLSDGSKIVNTDGSLHLVKDDKVLQEYETVKYVTPETAELLRSVTNGHAPDGTAVTLTTNGNDLLLESDFLNEDFTIAPDKTGVSRRPIPVEENAEGNVPVFVSKTRTTDGVRQNPFMIAPGKVESTLGAAEAGFGQQKESEYLKKQRAKYGFEVSQELDLSTEQFTENPDGTVTSNDIPLQTYFPSTHEETGSDAQNIINEKGIAGSMDYLRNLERYNKTDQGVIAILTKKFQDAYFKARGPDPLNPKDPKNLFRLNELLGEAELLNAKVGNVAGSLLGSRTEKALSSITGMSPGELKVSQIQTELQKQAYEEYQKETGEDLNLTVLKENAARAEAEMKTNEAPPAKEGETAKPQDPETQKKYDEAKAKYDKTVEKIKNAEEKIGSKLSKLNPEDAASLKDLYDILNTTQPGTVQVAVANKIFDMESKLFTKDSSPEYFDKLYNFYRSNLLSGPSTQARNFLGNLSSALSNVVGLIGKGDFRLAGLYTKEWLKGTPEAFREAGQILVGQKEGRFKFGDKVTDSSGAVKNLNKTAPLDNPLTFVQNVMYRLLNAQDMIFYRNAHSAMSYLAEDLANKNISDPKERRQAVEQALYRTPERLEEVTKKVNQQAATLKKAGIDLTPSQIKESIYEAMEQSRSEATRDIANRHAEKSIFVNDPTGVMGAFYDTIEFVADKFAADIGGSKVKPLKLIMPFTRVASNVTSHIMEFTPVGTFKALINKPDAPSGIFNHALTQADAKMVMGRSIVGNMIMGGFLSLAYAYKDEENPFIEFYGYPPKGKWKEWKEKGIDSFSMRIGDTVIPLQGTSLAIIPAILGGAMEQVKTGADIQDVVKTAAIASMGAVSTMSFLKPAGDLFDHILGSKDVVTSESGSSQKKDSNFWKGQADTITSGFIPASGFLNNLGRWMNESPTESYNNLSAKILGDMPFAREMGIGKPQLNMFGEPVTKTLLERFSAGLAPHTIKTDPVFLWMEETGYSIPDQGPILRLSTQREKILYGDKQKEETGYKDILDEEQTRKVLETSGPQIKTFLQTLMKSPGFQTLNERNQKAINTQVNKIRSVAKFKVLSED